MNNEKLLKNFCLINNEPNIKKKLTDYVIPCLPARQAASEPESP